MQWEELSAANFQAAVTESEGVCILPIGVLEKHGNHLPVGTDMMIGQAVCKAAAQMEKAVVFPYYFLGQIAEARHYPGCIAPSHRLIMDALLEMCDEIHRNGFKKIIIYSSHGGNRCFIPFFLQEMPRLARDYGAYHYFSATLSEEQMERLHELAGPSDPGGHAGWSETSLIMHLRPELVDMAAQDAREGESEGRLADLRGKGVFSAFDWYAEFPRHIAGDPSPATAAIGKLHFEMQCENLVEVIRLVKADQCSAGMMSEFAGM